ncbi:N-6 DNA methylase [Dolichospermum sp. ST_con]|nr:N-6 DNA methylase [Dolichospermum sp. ST_con]MDD1420742.1 N-6 DNA methylase [Dolichospermum sp. ST_sed1]MDD1428094.1 N-6 DNA methylase [Dolichospermum sp. ST_sed9]MDD1434436.1 N-6 DNA methylase [Dolichospermum sp. ST_sed6]MDD1438035.1 N-6 DNA methylase [Dolichospermum sp. ST_sed10]MDD1443643.1 N-6 DNA methylase [Dolichospermum sp. ST_sed3]MDD1458063.1 N-6 DNA methylase [Dolichospermum sp. ST_sed7]MDD1463351.1 N-6 DNA methylase [Dolichospermum sp. ST_sed2]MDD1468899.1 N-6 DNA methylase [D
MSRLLVTQYQAEVEKIIQYGGSRKETSIRVAFQNLLNEYCKPRDFLLIPELDYKLPNGKLVYPDGTIKDALRLDWGYWESKDQYDKLDEEIEKKLNKGYPDSNILFEDSQTAVLIQSGQENQRVSMRDADAVDRIINNFINYVRPEVRDFREAIEIFKEDLPTVLNSLRDLIDLQGKNNTSFQTARDKFWGICKESINPEISLFDIREMMIQHILTEDIFINIFNESQFHTENNVARELQGVISTFFTGSIKKNTLGSIERYYAVIRRTAANIYNHQEKQKFLKALYENFYKAYNPKAADRLGIVYTPNEIVRFMIESVDFLTHKHFGKLLADKDVEILDPATGTGTFITELIDYLPQQSLEHKYKHEIHCNEVAILPYYIANLNIEYTYKQKMGVYEEFENICFVDTLDNTSFAGKQLDLFAMSVENTARIKRQNDRTISVIIGNPPYNAKQENFNDNNANRYYTAIDKLIKESYIKYSKAQNNIVVYDMYTRFIRWASDRLGKNGIIAFITNSSFIDGRAFDGFRKAVTDDFSYIYIIDLHGDVRRNPKLSGTTHNVFGIQTGVAIMFLVKKLNSDFNNCQIFHIRRPDFDTASEKLKFLSQTKFNQIPFEHITPDKNYNWINQSDNDFETLLPLIDKDVKAGKGEKAIFKLFSSGLKTQRDEWVYDLSEEYLANKMKFFVEIYQNQFEKQPEEELSKQIKWDEDLKNYFKRGIKKEFDEKSIHLSLYRPFYKEHLYFDQHFNGRTYQWFNIYNKNDINYYMSVPGIGASKPFQCLITNQITCLDFLEKTQCFSLYRYDREGKRIDNITDWGLKQIQTHYQDSTITKIDIFHYTYAVLHNPAYRSKYELNLKREFPRLPYYENFHKWVNWGKQLMELHINYETVIPYQLTSVDIPLKDNQKTPKPKLKADKTSCCIILDDVTTLSGIPNIAWEYMLGNRCALEWILDQYKEKKPKDPTIAEKFNTYRFADYKEQVIELLMRVCTVSVETMNIIKEME